MKERPLDYYTRLGNVKSEELYGKSDSLNKLLLKGERHTKISGIFREGIVKEFLVDYVPPNYSIGQGLVYYYSQGEGTYSPEIDVIIYKGSPLMRFGDIVIVENTKVILLIEVKTWIDAGNVFGALNKKTKKRDSKTGLWKSNHDRKKYGKCALIVFSLDIGDRTDKMVNNRLESITDIPVIISRKIGQNRQFNYNNTVSNFIHWLQSL